MKLTVYAGLSGQLGPGIQVPLPPQPTPTHNIFYMGSGTETQVKGKYFTVWAISPAEMYRD